MYLSQVIFSQNFYYAKKFISMTFNMSHCLSLAFTLSWGEEVAICWSWIFIASLRLPLRTTRIRLNSFTWSLPSAVLAKPIKIVIWEEAGVSQCGEQGLAHRALFCSESLFSQTKAFNYGRSFICQMRSPSGMCC